jgi:hypothetical protein
MAPNFTGYFFTGNTGCSPNSKLDPGLSLLFGVHRFPNPRQRNHRLSFRLLR